MRKFCQQRLLLAGLALFCLLLPFLAGTAAEHILSEGVSFSGLTIAVAAPEGDPLPELVEQYTGKMSDLRQYCSFQAMEREEALRALEDGTVTAVLELPENFVQGIRWGENPSVTLIVPEDRPLESLLTLWVGQSLSDLLSAFQAAVYAVLDIYDQQPAADITRDEVILEINLRYINWTLNRQDLFREREIQVTAGLPVVQHYGVCLLAYLTMAVTPLFSSVYTGAWLSGQKRWRCVGRGSVQAYLGTLAGTAAAMLLFTALPLLVLAREALLPMLGIAVLWSVFCAAFGSVCCLLTHNTAGCGGVVFLTALAALLLGGGILPPVLMPELLSSLSVASPVTWLHTLTASALGYETNGPGLLLMGVTSVALIVLSAYLYDRRISGQEAGQ